jgi:alkyl sulfatase BDS1-like metallo-beta-lactamase superfamily hydrolase
MADLFALSARVIDEGFYEGPGTINRLTMELSELAPGVAFIESFSHVALFDTDDGLVVFDASLEALAEPVLKALRGWSEKPVHTLAFTHGHVDHVGGAHAFVADTLARGGRRPRIVAHAKVPERFLRYERTSGYNTVINQRQFGRGGLMRDGRFGPAHWVAPDATFDTSMGLRVGDLAVELRHALGETDDHLWAWIPERKALAIGDFLIWAFPNAGNPQKVQRYPLEWARALREMSAIGAEILLPAHGLPVAGAERIRRILGDTARALESIVEQTLALMNAGATLDDAIHTVKVPADLAGRPYLQPTYDDPEFVVRNVWRQYGGWYDGDPARLMPARAAAVAREMAALAGGAGRLVARAKELADAGELRLACHLVETAVQAAPDDREAHTARAEVYTLRRREATSLMAKGIYRAAADESVRKAKGE